MYLTAFELGARLDATNCSALHTTAGGTLKVPHVIRLENWRRNKIPPFKGRKWKVRQYSLGSVVITAKYLAHNV